MLTPSGRKIDEMSSITVAKTIEVLRGIFASYGLPEQIVTDNGPQFTATDFANFMKANGIRQRTLPPSLQWFGGEASTVL